MVPDEARRSGPFWEAMEGRAPMPPAAVLLGWRLSWVAPERGEIEVFFEAGEQFTNPMGNVQGRFLAAMLDDTLGPALAATLAPDEFAPTLELKVSFLRPAARAGWSAAAGSSTAAAPSPFWRATCSMPPAPRWRAPPRRPGCCGRSEVVGGFAPERRGEGS